MDEYYKHAALEAMIQVELALKEKSEIKDKWGVNLIANLFSDGKGIKLRVPFGDEMQKQAEALFKGAFSYYRNYCAHAGQKIDRQICLRVMVLASELLDLIGASKLSFTDIGGIEGLIKAGIFLDEENVIDLLWILDGFSLPDEDVRRLEDVLLERGYSFSQIEPLIDTGLIDYVSEPYIVPIELLDIKETLPDTVSWFQLTDLGKKIAKRK